MADDRTVNKSLFLHNLYWLGWNAYIIVKALCMIVWRRLTVPGERAESKFEFELKVANVMENSLLAAQLALGFRLGIFEKFHALNGTATTSTDLADSLGLKERYVREWLDGMVAVKVVETDTANTTYWLPPYRAESLSAAGRPFFTKLFGMNPDVNMIEVFLSQMPIFYRIFDDVENCFRKDGPSGVGYDRYGNIHEYIGKMSRATFTPDFMSNFAAALPKSLKEQLGSGLNHLDIGCGSGDVTMSLASLYPNSRFHGVDLTPECVEGAQKNAIANGLSNTEFIASDASHLPKDWEGKFDWATAVEMVHDCSFPDQILAEAHRVLKSGGYFSLVDIYCHSNAKFNQAVPSSKLAYGISLFHCMPVSLVEEGGKGLGTMWGLESATRMLKEAGFEISASGFAPGQPFSFHILARKI